MTAGATIADAAAAALALIELTPEVRRRVEVGGTMRMIGVEAAPAVKEVPAVFDTQETRKVPIVQVAALSDARLLVSAVATLCKRPPGKLYV